MTKYDRVFNASKHYASAEQHLKRLSDRRSRLQALVGEFDTKLVATAAGLSPSTVEVYCRNTKTPPVISEETVTRAESILHNL